MAVWDSTSTSRTNKNTGPIVKNVVYLQLQLVRENTAQHSTWKHSAASTWKHSAAQPAYTLTVRGAKWRKRVFVKSR